MSINDYPSVPPAPTSHPDVGQLAPRAHPSARPDPPDRSVPTVALALALGSLIAPILMWAIVSAMHTVSSDAVGGLVLLMFASCGAALFGFIMGIIGRHDGRGATAIGVSILGGLVSLGSLFAIGMAMAFAGMNAGL
jgi:ACR3 family arsenite efflux pump ArsB